MQNKMILLSMVLFLSACAATTKVPVINTVIQKVEVPIAVPCNAKIPLSPVFSFGKLTEENSIFDKSKATLSDRYLYDAYIAELIVALNSCIK
jgi:hypothetical protein